MSHKQQVIDYLQTDRTFTGGRNLYNKLPGRSMAFLASINRMRNTPENIKHIAFQLCSLVGIPERQMNVYLNKPVTKAEKKQKASPAKETSSDAPSVLQGISEKMTRKDLLDLAHKYPEHSKINEIGQPKLPEWKKGIKGNQQRKQWLRDVGIEEIPTKNKELDVLIETTAAKATEDKAIHNLLEASKNIKKKK